MNDVIDSQEAHWPALWVRAAMRTAILSCLESGPLHGYAISLALEGIGFGRPKGGSLYPILEELKSCGAVVDDWETGDGGPGRRVYRITEAGTDRLARERMQWRSLAEALSGGDAGSSSALVPESDAVKDDAKEPESNSTAEIHG